MLLQAGAAFLKRSPGQLLAGNITMYVYDNIVNLKLNNAMHIYWIFM